MKKQAAGNIILISLFIILVMTSIVITLNQVVLAEQKSINYFCDLQIAKNYSRLTMRQAEQDVLNFDESYHMQNIDKAKHGAAYKIYEKSLSAQPSYTFELLNTSFAYNKESGTRLYRITSQACGRDKNTVSNLQEYFIVESRTGFIKLPAGML